MKHKWITFSCAALFAVLMTGQAVAHTAQQALDTVKQSVSVVLSDLKVHKAEYKRNPAALNRMIDSKVLPYFDVDAMARLVLGKHWRGATETQRKTFLHEFKDLVLRTYSSELLDYANARVEYGKPSKVKNRKRTKIGASIINSDGKRYNLVLSMAYRNGKWKGYDVSMDGLSIVTSYRSSLGEEVSRKGIQTVIDEIKDLNAKGAIKK
ncbi:MAG: hypothetical protein CSA47_01890 [Gammaproteobacteria bacterium]|nr:MAG: hypothetical protein CSA47_01890 [Gammaproteobacteria bacterium]